jgi:hypothetical protein
MSLILDSPISPVLTPPEEVVWVLSTIAVRESPDEILSLLQKDIILIFYETLAV